MMEREDSKQLWMLSEWADSNLEKYVWLDNPMEELDDYYFFMWLLQKKVYIKGFATDHGVLSGHKIFHKPVVEIQTLNKKNAVVLTHNKIDYDICKVGWVLNPILSKAALSGEVIIYGAGFNGKYVKTVLESNNIKVRCFIDKELSKKTDCIQGIPVYGIERIDELSEASVIIEALKNWKEVDDLILAKNNKAEKMHFAVDDFFTIDTSQGQTRFPEWTDHISLFRCFEGKKIYIYGTSEEAVLFGEYLKLLDFDFRGFLSDEPQIGVGRICSYPINYVEDILYEESFYIYIWEDNLVKACKKCRELGLEYFTDYQGRKNCSDIAMRRETVLDVNLGYSYLYKSKYPGITIYGEEKEENYKIAILGGSTTDGSTFPFKCWSEILFEKLGRDDITIYNAGVSGYNTGQELIKLLRDILFLSPDMIVSYSGVNDTGGQIGQRPFAFHYAGIIYDYALMHVEETTGLTCHTMMNGAKEVVRGIWGNQSNFDSWLVNMRHMYAITQMHGISFYGFMQPMLATKRRKSEQEENMYLTVKACKGLWPEQEKFRSYMAERKIEDHYNYLFDLSHIFDDKGDIYMDSCHVWEKGNEIIAEEICERIIMEISKWRKLKDE